MNAAKVAEVERWLAAIADDASAGEARAGAILTGARALWDALKDLPDSQYTDLTICKFSDTLSLAFVAARR